MKRLLLGLLLLLIPVHVGAETVIINGVTVVLGSSIVNPTITGGTIDGTVIGGTTPAAGSFTTLVANTLDTGQGANELYDMDQNVLTTSGVTFGDAVLGVAATDPGNLTIHDGGILTMWDDGNDFSVTLQVTDGTTQLHLTGILDVSGNIYAGGNASPDSGDGATLGTVDREWSDLYLASSGVIYGENDQSNTLTSSATGWTANLNFTATGALAGATLNTGQGAYELYAMNQDVETTDSPTFVTAKLSGLTDTYIPYHVADATGLADSPLIRAGTSTVTLSAAQDAAATFSLYADAGDDAADKIALSMSAAGVFSIQPSADSVTGVQILDTDGGTPILNVDTTNERVGIGTAAPAVSLDVVGNVRASTGILFGSDTAAANTLDDYEEGTYEPTITCSTSGSYVMSTNKTLAYTKLGRKMMINGILEITSEDSPVGTLRVSLPTATPDLAERVAFSTGASYLTAHGSTLANNVIPLLIENSAYITLRQIADDGTYQDLDQDDVDTAWNLIICIIYITE